MKSCDLSVLIPARSEMFLRQTVEDVLAHAEADTEVIVALDGAWAEPPLVQHERVSVIYVPVSVGQRAATNLAARLARGRYLMKLDAHCAMDQGFDARLLTSFERLDREGESVTLVPVMRNLWAFSWKCYHCGWKGYQGPTPERCGNPKCGKGDRLKRKLVWQAKPSPQSVSYRFDPEPHFQYFSEYTHRAEYQRDLAATGLTETMSLQGSCFVLTRERYWDLAICDERLGSWGNQGIEVACKTWLSDGRVLVDHSTFYGHMFRTQGGDFSFPYPNPGREVERTKRRTADLFWGGKWDKLQKPLSWLVERFWPVPGWSDEDLARLKATEAARQGTRELEPELVAV